MPQDAGSKFNAEASLHRTLRVIYVLIVLNDQPDGVKRVTAVGVFACFCLVEVLDRQVIIIEFEVIAHGLAMPPSPRWYDGKLWILESGKGSLATVSVETGEVTTIATLPGFTRGLNFIGPYALVGLSQVRESVFKNLPITSQKEERNCGVWIVDIRNGEIVGELKFSGMVKEIFDVKVLHNTKWPTILDEPGLVQSHFVLSSNHAQQVPK